MVKITDRDAYNSTRDSLSYPEIPQAELFQHGYGYEKPVAIHEWDWSATFGRWTALVTFANGDRTWTFPKR